MYLSDHCYALLQKIQQELALKPRSIRSASSPSIRELKNWCDRHELPTGHWLTPGQALFTPQVLDEIDELLAALNQPLIGQVHSGQNRLAQAQNSSRENKSHGQPRQGRLLLLFENTGCNPAPLREAPADLVLDVAKTQLATDRYHSLLVVENLDCFYQCLQLHRQQRYQLPQACLDALIVFRGDGHDSKSVLQLVRDFRRQNRQTIYFGDFDAPGLCIALQNGYSHILLPEPDFLLKHACAEHNDPDQQKQFEWLQANTCNLPAAAPLRPCLDILIRDFRALKQQWFRAQLHSIPLP